MNFRLSISATSWLLTPVAKTVCQARYLGGYDLSIIHSGKRSGGNMNNRGVNR